MTILPEFLDMQIETYTAVFNAAPASVCLSSGQRKLWWGHKWIYILVD